MYLPEARVPKKAPRPVPARWPVQFDALAWWKVEDVAVPPFAAPPHRRHRVDRAVWRSRVTIPRALQVDDDEIEHLVSGCMVDRSSGDRRSAPVGPEEE